MQLTMTLPNILALFAAMAALAAIPGVSVLTVASRAASHGFSHGIFATMGIIAGDILYIFLALFGLALLADALGVWSVLINYAAAAWMIWMGFALWHSAGTAEADRQMKNGSPLSSFTAGLLVTLADQKAVLFYLGFLPAFVDLKNVTLADMMMVAAVAVLALATTKLAYAWAAGRAGARMGARTGKWLNRMAGAIMLSIGLWLAIDR